jgi:hypothetical protein
MTNARHQNSFPSFHPVRGLCASCRWRGRHRHASLSTDGRAPDSKLGQPGRPFSAQRRGSVARSSTCNEGNFSWVNQKGILHSRRMKCGAMDCNRVQWIAPTCRQCTSAPRAGSGQKRPPNIGPLQRACSLARSSTGLQATKFQTRGAWRLSVCSHSPPITGEWSPSNTERMTTLWPTGVAGGLTHTRTRRH